MPTHRLSKELLWFGLFAVFTILMTWPWVLHMRDTVSDPGDPYLNSWILAWDYRQTFHDPRHLFDGNILYPMRRTLAFSENMYGLAVLVFPLFALGLRPVTVHGIAELLAFALCGYGMFRLTRTATGATVAALVSGIIFAFVPFRFGHLSHLTYVHSVWIPLTLEALILFMRRRTWKRAIWLGVAYFFNGLSCIHWFVLTLIPLLLAFFLLAWARNLLKEPALWIRSAAAVAVASLALLPFFLPYITVARAYGMVRSSAENLSFSAYPRDWLVIPFDTVLYKNRPDYDSRWECFLFPGFGTILLMGAAIFLVQNRRREESGPSASAPARRPTRRAGLHGLDLVAILAFVATLYAAAFDRLRVVLWDREFFLTSSVGRPLLVFSLAVLIRWWIRLPEVFGDRAGRGLGDYLRAARRPELWVAWVWVGVGFLGSLGMNFPFHRMLSEYIPLYRSIRAPVRWANIAYVGLALLAGVGAAALIERVTRRSLRKAVVGLLILALLFELHMPFRDLIRAEVDPAPVYLAIKDLPMRGGLVELPVNNTSVYCYTLRAADHWKPLITAVSGFGTPHEAKIYELALRQPIPDELFNVLESIPTSYVIVHEEYLTVAERAAYHDLLWRGMQAGRIRFIKRYGGEFAHRDDLYAIPKVEPSAKTEEMIAWLPPGAVPLENARGEDKPLPAAIESPESGQELSGDPLVVTGWCQDEAGYPCPTIRIFIDEEERRPEKFERQPRPDLEELVAGVDAKSAIGFQATYHFDPAEGREQGREHSVLVFCQTRDGRYCRLGPYTFQWTP